MAQYTTLFAAALNSFNETRGKVPFLDDQASLYSCGAAVMTAGSISGTGTYNGNTNAGLTYASLVTSNQANGKVEWLDNQALQTAAADAIRIILGLTNS